MSRGSDGWIDLSVPVTPDVPKVSVLPCPTFEALSGQSTTSLRTTTVSMATHIGTHFDAASHALEEGRDIDDYDVNRFTSTAAVCRVEAEPNDAIGIDDVAHLEYALGDADALLFSTGWEHHFGSTRYHQHPYLETALAEWLVGRDLDWIGVDFLTPDMPGALRPDGFTFPVHGTLLGGDVLIAENLTNLERFESTLIDVVALPLKLAELDGAPARVIASPHAGDVG